MPRLKCRCNDPDRQYNGEWDAYYCETCNEWLEAKCGCTTLEECPFACWKRPDYPRQLSTLEEEVHQIIKDYT